MPRGRTFNSIWFKGWITALARLVNWISFLRPSMTSRQNREFCDDLLVQSRFNPMTLEMIRRLTLLSRRACLMTFVKGLKRRSSGPGVPVRRPLFPSFISTGFQRVRERSVRFLTGLPRAWEPTSISPASPGMGEPAKRWRRPPRMTG